MIEPSLPHDEAARLAELNAYDVLDTSAETAFDDITRLASRLCGTPIALVSLVDAERQWFKSKVGLEATETPRNIAFCAHAISRPGELLVVPDAQLDERFHDNPLVTGEPHVRFYAGAPLIAPNGSALGTLCVIDSGPRSFGDDQRELLRVLAGQVVAQLELRRKCADLGRAHRLADTANQAKSEFLVNISQELRTPMTAILGMADLLAETEMTSEQGECVQTLRTAGRSLLELLNDVLDLSAIEAGKLVVRRDPFQLHELLRAVIDFLRPAAQRKGLELALDVGPNVSAAVIGDGQRLRQILLNLIENAIKFTERGRVEVRVRSDSKVVGNIHFEVADTGPGISHEDQARLFTPFTQLGVSNSQVRSGAGIGLSLSRRLAELMGGAIHLESELGSGSTLHVALSLPAAFGETAPVRELSADIGSSPPSAGQSATEPVPVAPAVALPAVRHRILLSDDSEASRLFVQQCLHGEQFQLVCTEGGAAGLRRFEEQRYAVVLMDPCLSRKDNCAAIASLRAFEATQRFARTPIVALTSGMRVEDRWQCLAAGADEHLHKPVSKQELLEMLQRCLRTSNPARCDVLPSDPHILLPAYLNKRRKDVTVLFESIATNDFTPIARIGLEIRTTALAVGLDQFTQIGIALERAAEKQDLRQVLGEAAALDDLLERFDAGEFAINALDGPA